MNESTTDTGNWLVADIGATSSRCAILAVPDRSAREVRIYRNENFPSLYDLLADYIERCDTRPQALALAVAAPVHGDKVRMVNRDWSFSGSSLASALELERAVIVNDYYAVAFALPSLADDARIEIGRAIEYRDGNRAVLGPGSGLGMAAWITDNSTGLPMTGEGGHITLSGRDEHEDEIIAMVRGRYGHCSAERILSGPGLRLLHEAIHGVDIGSPEAITENPDDPANAATLDQFFSFLGSVAAELALITGAFGGIYIGGGIVPACIDPLLRSPFRERFEDKNRYQDYMRRIPTYVITDPLPGLTGLAAMIEGG